MFVVAFIVAIMFYEVVLRYVFGKPTLWVEELSRWLGGIIFLLAGIYAMQQRSHIRVVIVYDMVSRPVQRICDAFSALCILIFCYAVIVGYAKNAWTKLVTWELYGSAWNPPIPAIMKPLILVACAWLAVQTINNLIVDWNPTKDARPDRRPLGHHHGSRKSPCCSLWALSFSVMGDWGSPPASSASASPTGNSVNAASSSSASGCTTSRSSTRSWQNTALHLHGDVAGAVTSQTTCTARSMCPRHGRIAIVTAIMAIIMATCLDHRRRGGSAGPDRAASDAAPRLRSEPRHRRCASGSLGTMIPPSIVLIIYGVVTSPRSTRFSRRRSSA